jgi:hypothetical protein
MYKVPHTASVTDSDHLLLGLQAMSALACITGALSMFILMEQILGFCNTGKSSSRGIDTSFDSYM